MPSDPLDVDELLRADPDRKWTGAPDGLVVGHMHLQVGALPAAEAFYRQILGFDISCRGTVKANKYRPFSASNLAARGCNS